MAIGYISTRGKAQRLGFCDAALGGLGSDGGLYVPDAWPLLDMPALQGKSYAETAFSVLQAFIGEEIPVSDLKSMIDKSCAAFSNSDVVPLRRMENGIYIAELFHGPTLAFKDVALQFLGHLFDYILAERKTRAVIVGATSGDTGSAAIEAFRGKAHADIFILHPKGRVSEVQRRQMTTVLDNNVRNIAIDGSFDDCQDIVKALFTDAGFRTRMQLSAVNSINWARILAQAVYYIYTGLRVMVETGSAPAFCVPTGNFGNVYAGYVAHKSGLDINRLIVAANRNDILDRFFKTGVMTAERVAPSLSPSMDIQVSSNFERLLFDAIGRNGEDVAGAMQKFRADGSFKMDGGAFKGISRLFASGRADDTETLAAIKRVYTAENYVLDPHTAVGAHVAEGFHARHPEVPLVLLATAHPAKFQDAVEKAIGQRPSLPPRLADLFDRPERYDTLPNDVSGVKEYITGHVHG